MIRLRGRWGRSPGLPLGYQATRRVFTTLALGALAWAYILLLADTPAIRFIDIAAQSGLTIPNTFGGKERKDYIIEGTGTGAAVFDYNGDGANDVFIANGTVFTPGAQPTPSQLYRNDGKGNFTEVGRRGG